MSQLPPAKAARLSAFVGQAPAAVTFPLAKAAGVLAPILRVGAAAPALDGVCAGASALDPAGVWRRALSADAAGDGAVRSWLTVWLADLVSGRAGDLAAGRNALAAALERAGGPDARRAAVALRAHDTLTRVATQDAAAAERELTIMARAVADPDRDAISALITAAAAYGASPRAVLGAAAAVSKPRERRRLDQSGFTAAIAALAGVVAARARDEAVAAADGSDPDCIEALSAATGFRRLAAALDGKVTGPCLRAVNTMARADAPRYAARTVAAVEAIRDLVRSEAAGAPEPAEARLAAVDPAARFLAETAEASAVLGFDEARRSAIESVDAVLTRVTQELSRAAARPEDDAALREPRWRAGKAAIRRLQGEDAAAEVDRLIAAALGRRDLFNTVWAPVRGLVSDHPPPKRPGHLAPESLAAIWRWRGGARCADGWTRDEADFGEADRDGDRAGADALAGQVRDEVHEALTGALQPGAAPTELTGRVAEDAREILCLLEWETMVAEILGPADAPNADLGEPELDALRRLHDDIVAEQVDAGPLFVIFAARRAGRPSDVWRILTHITRHEHDQMLEVTEYVAVGDAALDDLEAALAAFERPRDGRFDAEAVLDALSGFGAMAHATLEDLAPRRTGRWGKRFFPTLSRGARLLEDLCQAAVAAVEAATPRAGAGRRGGMWRPVTDRQPDEAVVNTAVAYARFLAESIIHDERAGFATERAKAMREVEQRLDAHAEALVAAAHADDAGARAHLMALARITAVYSGEDAADLLRRRAEAA